MRACRTCLTKKDLNPLFGDLSDVRFTSKQLYLATGVSIQPNDNLPQLACKSCIKQIKKSLEFQFISNKTNVYLRQILKHIKIKSELMNSPNWTDDDDPDRFCENSEVFVEVKIEHDYLQHNDIDNNEIDNSQFKISHNYLDNKECDDSHFDYQKNCNRNDKSPSDNVNKYLDNNLNSKRQSNNYEKTYKHHDNHNSQLDKQLSDNENNKKHITRPKRQKTKQMTRKTKKIMIKTKRKLEIHDHKSNSDNCIDLSQNTNIKIEDYENNSTNSDISNKSSNKQQMASKSNENGNINDGIVIPDESKRNEFKIAREMSKQKRNKLMSLAITPYTSDGLLQCRVCNENVKLTSFVMHAKRHFAPEFTCEECGKMFRSHAHMVYHQQRLHGKEKRLACSLCDFRTVDRLKLKNHERCHSGERPYVCDECGASFRMRTNILQHMRTHFGLRYIQCELCANLFRSKSELANHKNKVHNKMTYLCYLCPQTYKGKRAVRRHLINIHGILEEQIMKIKSIKTKKFEEIPTN